MSRQQRDRAIDERMKAGDFRGPLQIARDERRAAIDRDLNTRNRTNVNEARRHMLERAIAGDHDALEHLRFDASWFAESTSFQYRNPNRPPSTDAELQRAARAMLPTLGGHQAQSPTTTARPTPAAPRRRMADLARDYYGGQSQARNT